MNERKENIYWYELYYAFGKRQNFKFSDPVTSLLKLKYYFYLK